MVVNDGINKGVIGLEIHAYLTTKEKLFCKCRASREKGLKANVNICPICTGQPGAKPMLPNGKAVEKAVAIGLMLGCKINQEMEWKRKHYSWPDLPKGYQNTLSGPKAVPVGEKGKFYGIGIWEMHLEEDPASWEPSTGKVDYNRSGLPLVEIVTAPDFTTAEEVVDWLNHLVHNLNYLKAIDTDAGIKVDVNVSVKGGERCEIKNLNSLENIGNAINYEIERQKKEGNASVQTRRWNAEKGKTEVMREKEGAEDYRFISDPDLLPLNLDKKFISEIKNKIPESPEVKLEKLIKKHKIDKKNAEVLAKNVDIVEFFEKVAEQIEAKFALPWVTVELMRVLNYNKTLLSKTEIKVEHFVSLLNLVKLKKITELQAKEILNKFYPKSFEPSAGNIVSASDLEGIIIKIVGENKKAVSDFKAGDDKALNFLIGAVMKATKKGADFKAVREMLLKMLK